jgi:hypothetical protein
MSVFKPKSGETVATGNAEMRAAALLTDERLRQCAFCPAAGEDYQTLQRLVERHADIIYLDIEMQYLFNAYGAESIGGYRVIRRELTTLDVVSGRNKNCDSEYIAAIDQKIQKTYSPDLRPVFIH